MMSCGTNDNKPTTATTAGVKQVHAMRFCHTHTTEYKLRGKCHCACMYESQGVCGSSWRETRWRSWWQNGPVCLAASGVSRGTEKRDRTYRWGGSSSSLTQSGPFTGPVARGKPAQPAVRSSGKSCTQQFSLQPAEVFTPNRWRKSSFVFALDFRLEKFSFLVPPHDTNNSCSMTVRPRPHVDSHFHVLAVWPFVNRLFSQ